MHKTAHTEAAEPAGWRANHIEETIRSGRPPFIGVLTVIAAGWISLNLLAAALGYRPIDPPPFSGLGGAVSLGRS